MVYLFTPHSIPICEIDVNILRNDLTRFLTSDIFGIKVMNIQKIRKVEKMSTEKALKHKILKTTQSICSVCHRPVDAVYLEEDGQVFFHKTCPVHGEERCLAAKNAEDFIKWIAAPVINIPPPRPLTKSGQGDGECPLHCGTCENHMQTACCVVIDVTNRCNQHCPYCFAVSDEEEAEEPTLDALGKQYDFLMELGEARSFNLQISGGEPTVRDDLPEIVSLAAKKGFEYIQLNTNGRRIAEEPGYAGKLRDAGTSVVFLQFDGTRDGIYRQLRNEPLLEIKKRAIEECRKAGLPVALVPTVVAGINDDNLGEMISFLLANLDIVKGIHFQPVCYFGRHPEAEKRVTMFDVIDGITSQDDRFVQRDFAPITAGHPLCCFYGTFLNEGEKITSLLSDRKKSEGIGCCDTGCVPDPQEIIRKDRDFVLNKWNPKQTKCEPAPSAAEEESDFDRFLTLMRENTFTLSGMAFQDSTNMDGDRLKRCRVQVLTPDNRLIPFCAYNGLYRGENQC